VGSFLIPNNADPLLSSKSVASFFKKLSAFSHQSSEVEPLKVQVEELRAELVRLDSSTFDLDLRLSFWPQAVASFLFLPSADPLLSINSVASFFKKALSFHPSAVTCCVIFLDLRL